jgi:hypothetical protein
MIRYSVLAMRTSENLITGKAPRMHLLRASMNRIGSEPLRAKMVIIEALGAPQPPVEMEAPWR